MPAKPEDSMVDRKAKHLAICLDEDRYRVEGGDAGFSHYRFIHRSLPELSMSDIDTGLEFLGHHISLPFFISSMTGGSDEGYRINKDLARLAQTKGIPVGMGSLRILFRKPEVFEHFTLKKTAPDVPVVGNLGAVQIRDMVHSEIVEMLKRLEIDALAIHLNPAQELFQHDGDTDFSGIIDGVRRFCAVSPVPVIVKETGCGITPQEAAKLLSAGVSYVNVAGSGGTNWAMVEAARCDGALRTASADFADWGNSTALILDSLRYMESTSRIPASSLQARSLHQTKAVHSANKSLDRTRDNQASAGQKTFKGLLGGRVLASGGIRNGMDLAKSLALGAYAGGTALPLVRVLSRGGFDAALEWIEALEASLKRTMLLTGSPTLAHLRAQPLLVDHDWKDAVEQMVRAMGGNLA